MKMNETKLYAEIEDLKNKQVVSFVDQNKSQLNSSIMANRGVSSSVAVEEKISELETIILD